jgi:hypothetical protein
VTLDQGGRPLRGFAKLEPLTLRIHVTHGWDVIYA